MRQTEKNKQKLNDASIRAHLFLVGIKVAVVKSIFLCNFLSSKNKDYHTIIYFYLIQFSLRCDVELGIQKQDNKLK